MTNAARNDAAFQQLFEEHANTIYSLGMRMCPTESEAEDLVQETFLNAYKAWDGFEGRSKPSTWLWTIAVRACQRMNRKRSGEPERIEPLENLLPSPDDDIPDLPAGDAPDALDDLVRREAQEAVERAIGELPHTFRLALVLKDIADLSLAEIAKITGSKEATVKTRVHRARLLLRNALADALTKRPPKADHANHVCLDLLHGKQEALDRGVPFAVPDAELCDRCRAMFASLDLVRDACLTIRGGELPPALAERVKARFSTSQAD